jgi:hypothetical protein
MRIPLFGMFLFLSSFNAHALSDVQIVEVGLKGYYSTMTATPVWVQVTGPPQEGPVRLDFTVTSGDPENYVPSRTDHFSQDVPVKPGETLQLKVPLLLTASSHSKLELSASGPDGRRIGSSSVNLDPRAVVSGQVLIVILCQDHRFCDEAQSQISFSGADEETTEKSRTLKFVTLSAPRENWWEYSAARFVVVADSIRNWTPGQKSALEYYVRSGGALVLAEKEVADASFLAPYPRKEEKTDPRSVGFGRLYRVADLAGKELSSLFSGISYKKMVGSYPAEVFSYGDRGLDLRRRVGTSFDFPRLLWVLIWLGAYILIIGVANFSLLRRWRRLEWGWGTSACLATLFACGLYAASSMRRPKHMTLDDIVVYRMDSRSPIASEQILVRVSTPDRIATSVSVGDGALLDAHGSAPWKTENAHIATEITRAQATTPGWQMQLGPPVEVDLSLLRWSFADLDFETFHVFPGSLRMVSEMHLRNNSGQLFREAVYLDIENNLKYFVPGLAPGQEVDLRSIPSEPIWRDVTVTTGRNQLTTRQSAADPPVSQRPFSLKRVPCEDLRFGNSNHFVVALSDAPVPDASLRGMRFVRQNLAVTVVALD